MKKIALFLMVFSGLLIFTNCDDAEGAILVEPKNEINDFVWHGMNSWYNWQSNVPLLADEKNDNSDEYNAFLSGYSSPEELFDALLYEKGTTDRFSWIVDDYVALANQFQGVFKAFGFRLQAIQIDNNGTLILNVRHVIPNSPASAAGIQRGDIINALDGVILTSSNYSANSSKLSNETLTLSFVENDGVTFKEDKTITSAVVSENPIFLSKVFNNIGGKKVGYLVYNRFSFSYNDELNKAFADFKAEGVQEMILDLRLNGGGSVLTTAYLGSMLYNAGGTDTFANLTFNPKHSVENDSYFFDNILNVYDADGVKTGEETINRLSSIQQVYVLTSKSTASASELIINSLKPFIPVKLVGDTTFGKNVGSITLYDSPGSDYSNQSSANTSHTYAMQPIVFQIFNKLNESDYTLGFNPDIEVLEYQYWDEILPFGDENEVVLKAALDDIRGVSTSALRKRSQHIKNFNIPEKRFEKEMYIQHDFFKNK